MLSPAWFYDGIFKPPHFRVKTEWATVRPPTINNTMVVKRLRLVKAVPPLVRVDSPVNDSVDSAVVVEAVVAPAASATVNDQPALSRSMERAVKPLLRVLEKRAQVEHPNHVAEVVVSDEVAVDAIAAMAPGSPLVKVATMPL